jgi:hypothetical protein
MTGPIIPREPSKHEMLGRDLVRKLCELARQGYTVEELVRLLREPTPRRAE